LMVSGLDYIRTLILIPSFFFSFDLLID